MTNKKIKFFLLSFLLLFFPLFAEAENNEGGANLRDAFGKPLEKVTGEAGYESADQYSIRVIIATIIRVVLSLLGIVFLILTIYGGFLWMTASGNEERVTKAKNILRAAVIGIIIVVSAYAISWQVMWYLSEKTLDSSSGGSSGETVVEDIN